MRWIGYVVSLGGGGDEKCIKILVGKPDGRRFLGSRIRRCEDNIKMVLKEIRWEGMDWNKPAQDIIHWRVLVNTVTNVRVL
jgi:hypothetical protein